MLTAFTEVERGSFPPMGVFTNPSVRGGDLTTLLGSARDADPYKEWKPAATNWSDEFGFRNRPPTVSQKYRVVTVGDSFMLAGPRMEDTFAGCLERKLGEPIYNYAVDGRGAVWPMARFLHSPRFADGFPAVVVWGLLERDLENLAWSDELARELNAEPLGVCAGWSLPVRRDALTPSSLKKTLPGSSALAQLARRAGTQIGRLLPNARRSVVVASVCGNMLFYEPAIRRLNEPVCSNEIARIARTVIFVSDECRKRGAVLVAVLIPDKEHVYCEWLPDPPVEEHDRASALEQTLRQNELILVNLLPVLREESRRGQLLYWRDDTHWNTVGIERSVEAALPVIRQALETKRAAYVIQ